MIAIRKIKKLDWLWTAIVRNKHRLPPSHLGPNLSSKTVIHGQKHHLPDLEDIDTEYLEEVLEDEVHEEISAGVSKPRRIRKREEQQLASQLLKDQILFRKSLPKEPNLLTWAARWQIQELHRQHPDEWTAEKLAENFPVSKYTIAKVLKNKRIARSEDEIISHDRRVNNNWLAVKQSIENYTVGKPVHPAHEFLLANKKLKLMVNAAGVSGKPYPNVKDLVAPSFIEKERATRRGGHFLSIIQSYNKQLSEATESGEIVTHEFDENEITSGSDTVKLLNSISTGNTSEVTKGHEEYQLKSADSLSDEHEVNHTKMREMRDRNHMRSDVAHNHKLQNVSNKNSSFMAKGKSRTKASDEYDISVIRNSNEQEKLKYNSAIDLHANNVTGNDLKMLYARKQQARHSNRRNSYAGHDNIEHFKTQPKGSKLIPISQRAECFFGAIHNEPQPTVTSRRSRRRATSRHGDHINDMPEGVADLECIKVVPKHQLGKGFSKDAKEVYDQSGELLYRVP